MKSHENMEENRTLGIQGGVEGGRTWEMRKHKEKGPIG